MGDVVGALPIYLPDHDIQASVVIPRYKNKWFAENEFTPIHEGAFLMDSHKISYAVLQLKNETLPYPFYCIDLPGLFDRESIYLGANGHGYLDEPERNIAFQLSLLEWLTHSNESYDVIHCHDHMTGLIPFFVKYVTRYKKLKNIPTIFTIHNGQYRGIFDWKVASYFPAYDNTHNGLLDWDGNINSQATAIKCSWAVNTVSPSYMSELQEDSDTLTSLMRQESAKSVGIINGIDTTLWNPQTDQYLDTHLKQSDWDSFKSYHKSALVSSYNLKIRRPLISYIGRLAHQKGVDILIDAIRHLLRDKIPINFIILGTGDPYLEKELIQLNEYYKRDIATIIDYDEGLARQIYAASDFLMMPSRFEPCGLNQLYAMRYGTIPIVRRIGGLKDTVPDINNKGNGITFEEVDSSDLEMAILRARQLYKKKKEFLTLRKKITALDFSWKESAGQYATLYKKLTD